MSTAHTHEAGTHTCTQYNLREVRREYRWATEALDAARSAGDIGAIEGAEARAECAGAECARLFNFEGRTRAPEHVGRY